MLVNDSMARLQADTAALRLRMATLSRQLGTGQRAEAPGDIAPELPRAIALRAELGRRDAYGAAIGEAQGRAATTQAVLTRLLAIGREFAEGVAMKLDPDDAQSLPATAERARQALVEVGTLLNTRQGGEYLFGGSDFGNPPVPDPQGLPTGGMASQIAAAVATLGGGNAAAVAAATAAAAADTGAGVSPFSAFVEDPAGGASEPRRAVPAKDGVLLPFGLFANRNAAATSAGETVGGWARDLMRGLASLAALTPANAAGARDDFQAFAATIRDGLRSATRALGDEAGALGLAQARLDASRVRHGEVTVALKTQLSGIEEVDMAEALSRMQQTKTVLEASYGAIGRLGGLSLVQFLR